MLTVPSSRITQRSCPEGTSGQGMSDTKALTLGLVIFVVLIGNARNCRRLVMHIQPEMMKLSQLWVHFVSLTHEWWNQRNDFKSVQWSMCKVLLFMLQANLQVLNETTSSHISTLNRSWPGDDVQSAQNCVLPLLPSLLSNGCMTQNCLLREKLSE